MESPSILLIKKPFFFNLHNEVRTQARLEEFLKMGTDPQSSGICHRLFRLVLGALRRPYALPPPPARVQNGKISSGSEVLVEYRHVGSKDGLILNDDQNKKLRNGMKREKEKEKEKKSISIDGRERKEVAIYSGEKATMVEDDEETKTRIHWPLLGVESNINEKSEAFIERKKKAMTRNYILDQDHNKK